MRKIFITIVLCIASSVSFAKDKIIWKDAAGKYSEGVKGYLSMIGSLSADPKRSKDLADKIPGAVYSPSFDDLAEKLRAEAKPGDHFQFVRQGYFAVDPKDTRDGHLVFNRIVSLKSSFKLPK